jgi:spectinomycin phosphotransferase
MLDLGSPDDLSPYVYVTGTEINAAAIALYRLTWTLSDVAAYVAVLRSPHDRSADTDKACDAFSGYLPTRLNQ